MNVEMVKAEEFGLEESKGNELTVGLNTTIEERKLLIDEFNNVKNLEITKENIPTFKALRLKIVKNRTQGINVWHKANKEFFLTGGKFVDAVKNKELQINESMEKFLFKGEKHFENLEKEKQNALRIKRLEILELYGVEEIEGLGQMTESAWYFYEKGIKEDFKQKLADEKKAEKERLELEKSEKEKIEKQRIENIKLKKEAEENARIANLEKIKQAAILEAQKEKAANEARIEAEKQEKIKSKLAKIAKEERATKEKVEVELKKAKEKAAKEKAAKEKAVKEKAVKLELQKGDEEKRNDLIEDLTALKTKYSFDSEINKHKYSQVSVLLTKIINHIK